MRLIRIDESEPPIWYDVVDLEGTVYRFFLMPSVKQNASRNPRLRKGR